MSYNNNTIIKVKTTDILDKKERNDLLYLFNEVFEKTFTLYEFLEKFINNTKGYSYHSLLYVDGVLVGCYSVIPYRYLYRDRELIFGLSVDTMIKREYRGNPFTLKKLANKVYDFLKSENIPFVFGFPNDNVYLVRQKILKWKDIGQLNYYVLPINLVKIKKKLALIDPLYKIFILPFFTVTVSNQKITINSEKKDISLIKDESFVTSRFNDTYIVQSNENRYFCYKIYKENTVNTAYLVDIYPLNKENIENSIKNIYQKHKNELDIIIYVGNLDFNPKNLIKVPKKYEPKTVYMSGKILDKNKIDDSIFNINNWHVNLSNFDVR